ncbi:DUF922 domain-containing Zn-dependent protease [Flavobacteriaceae bacterium D16]|nr:DUF922 domain-containing Zn-dependent protease [Flavobacteriaceae bacterium D16]
MATIKYLLLFFSLLTASAVHAQEEEAILWSPEYRLSWDDFKGAPPSSGSVAATTASGISYYFSSTETNGKMEVDFTVRTYFYPQKSWYKADICNAVILSHEQLHFDIAEMFARKMRQQLTDTRFTSNIKAEVRVIYEQINRELADFQSQYDRETDFSRNVAQQKAWNAAIKEALGY